MIDLLLLSISISIAALLCRPTLSQREGALLGLAASRGPRCCKHLLLQMLNISMLLLRLVKALRAGASEASGSGRGSHGGWRAPTHRGAKPSSTSRWRVRKRRLSGGAGEAAHPHLRCLSPPLSRTGASSCWTIRKRRMKHQICLCR